MTEIFDVDPHDEALLRTVWETQQTAVRADRPQAVLQPWSAFRMSHTDPSPYYRRSLLVARDGAQVVGIAEIGGALQDNLHVGDLDVNVLPDRRREGIGRRLHGRARELLAADGRTSVTGEAFTYDDGAGAAVPFATALGAEVVHVEDHLVLDLSAAPDPSEGHLDDDYEIVAWGSACPDEHAAAYCAMKTQMSNDVPVGEVDHTPIVFDLERLRSSEERTGRTYHQLVVAARRSTDGIFGGYSQLFVPRDDASDALQDDTLVMPEHRGRRLGARLKAANLATIVREHPATLRVHTWTDPDNHAMYRINTDVGFVAVERLHEVQARSGRR